MGCIFLILNKNFHWECLDKANDGRPSDAHVHCLRNEKCACASDLNNMATRGGMFDQVLDQTVKLLAKR